MGSDSSLDVLSDVFEQIEVQGLVTGGFSVSAPWVSRGAVSRPLKLVAVVAGAARLAVTGSDGLDSSVDLSAGDVALLNHCAYLEIRGGRGGAEPVEVIPASDFDSMALAAADPARDDVLIGGSIEVGAAGLALLSAALPCLVHVRASNDAATRLAAIIDQLFDEACSARSGRAFALRQQGQLLLLEVLRTYLAQQEPPVGWLRLISDAALAPGLRLMHEHPEHPWRLTELARAAGMSRSGFCERFGAVAGTTPLAYLSSWRMMLAKRALRDPDVRIGHLATELGYGSDSAFSVAFKREVGESPLHYRRRVTTAVDDQDVAASVGTHLAAGGMSIR